MVPGQKNIILRYTLIMFIMALLAIAIIAKAAIIMFAERQYWKDVADRFIKENVIVHPTRGNIISADGKLMASSLPEYKIYMDYQLHKRGCDDRRELPFHKMLLAGELPLTIGGGIGQSRLSMLMMGCAHIGEVQSSVWDSETVDACAKAGIPLL